MNGTRLLLTDIYRGDLLQKTPEIRHLEKIIKRVITRLIYRSNAIIVQVDSEGGLAGS